MNIRLQTFNLVVFLSLGIMLLSLWSISVYWLQQQQNQQIRTNYQQSWQQQLNQLQQQQRAWLQNRWHELENAVVAVTDKESQYDFIHLFLQRHAGLSSLRLNSIQAGLAQSGPDFTGCRQAMMQQARQDKQPLIFDCQIQQRFFIGVAGRTQQAQQAPDLVLMMPYFSFIDDFKQLSGRQIVRIGNPGEIVSYREIQPQQGNPQYLDFEFADNQQLRGKLSLLLPTEDFRQLWQRQAIRVIPGLLLLLVLFYWLFQRAYFGPLIRLGSDMDKVMRRHLPGNADRRYLAPGLALLHRYFSNLTHQAKHDMLTGLGNRSIFEERLQQAIEDDIKFNRKYALVFIDIDQLHAINQQMGQFVGDGLLKQMARRLSNAIKESDSAGRLEEDNFALLLEFEHNDELSSLIERIYQSLVQPYQVYGRDIKVGIRMGVATYPEHAQDVNELALLTDRALLRAQKGEWPVVFQKEEGESSDFSAFKVIQSIRQALVNDEFKLVYQPVMHLKNHQNRYLEALLRWQNEDQHRHSIERTIELAEKNDLIKPLTHWIIESACAQLYVLELDQLQIAINLSMIDLHDEHLPDRIDRALTKYSVQPRQLMIEITEGQIMQDPQQVIQILERLSGMGISLTIDDFGTGQASLTYLKNLPVEKLKIDQSFVKNMVHDVDDRAIVEATIKLAHTLGKEVVAEGVENAEIHRLLTQMDCDYVQGYYISYPLEWNRLNDWYQQGNTRTAS